jgi:hypothetical protein
MRRVVLSVLALLVATGAAAQQTTGDIQGRILGAGGQPLADVQITVAGPSLQGDRRALSDARGRFVLRSLPAGSYAVGIRRIGYGPVRFQDVPVRLGSTTSLADVSLEVQPIDVAEVVVSGAKPVIDPVSPASGATLDSSQFSSLPAGRDFRDLIPFVPQANATPYASTFAGTADEVNIGGSTGLENAFYVDGVNVTVFAGTSITLPFNFVREIQVSTAGYEAEYGRALSGVINVVTPSGGNEFHGQALGFFTADELRTAPRVGAGAANPVNFNQYDVGLSLSGPIRRDRLWFSVAYDPTAAHQDVLLAALPKQTDTQVRHQLAGKLTWSPGGNTDVALTFLGDPYTHDWLIPNVLPATTDPNTALVHETGGGTTVAVEGRQRFGPKTQLTVGVSRLDRHLDIGPPSGATSLGAVTRLDDYITNASSLGVAGYDNSRESRTAVRLALTLLAGVHSWKFGAEFEDNRFAEGGIYSQISHLPDTANHDTVYVWFENYGHEHVRNRVPTVYVQDAWEVNRRFRVSAGLRWESQRRAMWARLARSPMSSRPAWVSSTSWVRPVPSACSQVPDDSTSRFRFGLSSSGTAPGRSWSDNTRRIPSSIRVTAASSRRRSITVQSPPPPTSWGSLTTSSPSGTTGLWAAPSRSARMPRTECSTGRSRTASPLGSRSSGWVTPGVGHSRQCRGRNNAMPPSSFRWNDRRPDPST